MLVAQTKVSVPAALFLLVARTKVSRPVARRISDVNWATHHKSQMAPGLRQAAEGQGDTFHLKDPAPSEYVYGDRVLFTENATYIRVRDIN